MRNVVLTRRVVSSLKFRRRGLSTYVDLDSQRPAIPTYRDFDSHFSRAKIESSAALLSDPLTISAYYFLQH